MKYSDALEIINKANKGYMVSFEKRGGGVLVSDHFPDKRNGEALIKTEEEAWKLAEDFAKATDPKVYVNIYVINENYYPVAHYSEKTIRKY